MNEDELAAIFAVIRAQQESAEKATADMLRAAEANRAVPGRALREAQEVTKEITAALKAGTDAALLRIDQATKDTADARVNAVLKPTLDRMERMQTAGNEAAAQLNRAAQRMEWSQKILYTAFGVILGALVVLGAFWIRINRISDDVDAIAAQQISVQEATSAGTRRSPPHAIKPGSKKSNGAE